MKTLYVSDLDGTLLQRNEKISNYTIQTINKLVEKGMMFSYATARSYQTASKVTKGLSLKNPLIIYNGAMIVDNVNGKILIKNFFNNDVYNLFIDLFEHDIFPIVYSFIDKVEKFSYILEKNTRGMNAFIDSRKGDRRSNPVNDIETLMKGEVFYIACIDEKSKLEPIYKKYKDLYHCILQIDIYTKEYFLEILPKESSKANAILQLKEYLGCEKLVLFGDGENDIDMFQIADEAYAVNNAVEELKKVATGIIEENNTDGVAKWLSKNYS